MCGESFTNAAKLVAHMRNIHGTIDKTYQCESCEYRGATHSALKAHMRAVHENIRKHRCDYCEFTSFASSALKRHILAIHEKRKPFECDKVIYLYNFSCRFLNTVLCISVRPRPKRLETRVIIKISTHPCYPRTFDYFSWD